MIHKVMVECLNNLINKKNLKNSFFFIQIKTNKIISSIWELLNNLWLNKSKQFGLINSDFGQ